MEVLTCNKIFVLLEWKKYVRKLDVNILLSHNDFIWFQEEFELYCDYDFQHYYINKQCTKTYQ